MAVSFKVPKSPKREIAATDTFMGVDLTNTGVSIEGYRSPYAPNMIRHVPGKVRKRMGYYKDILFGKKVNVNFALGTSSKARELMPYADEEWIKLYDLNQSVSGTVYLEFDYIAEQDFYLIDDNTVIPAAEPDEEGHFAHYSGTVTLSEDLTEVNLKTLIDQELYISNFALLLEKDTSYAWSPAPKYFVERESNDPIYGCHFLKKGVDGYDGDRVVNVNRVLNTSGTQDIIPPGSEDITFEYKLAEIPCPDQYVYVDFRSKINSRVPQNVNIVMIIGEDTDNEIYMGNGSQHHTERLKLNCTTNVIRFELHSHISSFDDIGLFISEFSIMYEKDENYEWSPAPEDNVEKFYIKDMYNIDKEEFSSVETIDKDSSTFTTDTYVDTTICTDDKHGGSHQYISFDITTSLTNTNAYSDTSCATVEFITKQGETESLLVDYFPNKEKKSFRKQHIDYFAVLPDDTYIEKIRVYFRNADASTKLHISISNLHIKNYTIRDNFVVHSMWYLYHVGKDFYLRASDQNIFTKVYSDANEHISRSWQLNDNSYIIDGKEIYEFTIEEGEDVHVIKDDYAYVPILTKAREPSGGGLSYEPLNLLQPGFKETFYGAAGVTKFQLSLDNLDDTPCKAWVADANMNMIPKTEGTDFTVNRETGEVTFTTAPGVSPLEGTPNVEIQAYKTIEGYRSRITKCITGVLFGVTGAPDRLFLTGNGDHPNWDFYSQFKDATYFPDTGYSVLGSVQSKIVGYAIVSNYLATFKDGFDMSQSVFVREGDLLQTESSEEVQTSDAVFKLINTLQGEGVVSPYAFGYLQTEPVFLTKQGVYAITEQDITGEKYSQNRSFYLDGQLRKEPNLEKALSAVYDNQYILALNNKLYILDGLQATRTDKSEPYATRQYAGFVCTDVPATALWTDDGLCFGTADGRVCRFYKDEEALGSYNDDGKPIYACWETPDLDGSLFYKNKTFRYFAVRLMKALRSSAKIYSRKLGVWSFIMEKTVICNPLDFENLDFENFTFSMDETEQVIHTKVRVKKVDKARFRIENGELDEPFGINDLALEYIESGNYKG